MDSVKNTLKWIYDNWSAIVICIGLIVGIYEKAMNYMKLTNDEKIGHAKTQIKETILEYITKAEFDKEELVKAGALKRAQVLNKIYSDYPILQKVVDQEELVKWIDELIEDALPTLEDVINNTLAEDDGEEVIFKL